MSVRSSAPAALAGIDLDRWGNTLAPARPAGGCPPTGPLRPPPEESTTVSDTVRFEGLTLTVASITAALAFYHGKLGLAVEVDAAPDFALLRIGGRQGGTIGLLSEAQARTDGAVASTPAQKRAIHVEFSCDDLDALHAALLARGVVFHQPPHDEPWERSMTAFDPDGYAVEFAQGRRGHNATGARP
jgi:catechol 2,3-dioxygenase-like lactoylglutathione lyase family enzyme